MAWIMHYVIYEGIPAFFPPVLTALSGFAQEKSVYIINGREVDSAALVGVKFKR